MWLERVRISGVRCLEEVELSLDPHKNYFFGPNGAGKTSLLEAIHLLGRGRSFRTRETKRLIQRGREGLSVFGETQDTGGRMRRIGVQLTGGRLTGRVDGVTCESIAELARILPVHVIDPRLHQLVEAGPSERRRFLDGGVFHVEHSYLASWRLYRRLLGQRNAALKAHATDAELKAWTEPLLDAAASVHAARSRYVAGLEALLEGLGQRLLGAQISADYRPGWRRDMDLAEALRESRQKDREAGFTQVGPHRADLRLRFDRGDIKDVASRGQQKLVAAALVIGQARLFEESTGQEGVLLVDDAAAELDSAALARLLSEIEVLRSQLVLTGLDRGALKATDGFPVFHVEQGKVRSVL